MAFSQIAIFAKQDARQGEDFKRREQAGTSPLRDIWGAPPGGALRKFSLQVIFPASRLSCMLQLFSHLTSCLFVVSCREGGAERRPGQERRAAYGDTTRSYLLADAAGICTPKGPCGSRPHPDTAQQ